MLVACVSACQGGKDEQRAKHAAPAPPTVGVLKVEPRPATVNVEHVARLEAENIVEIRPRVTGLLERQVVVEGARVKKDELLFELDKRPFAAELAAAQAALTQSRATLERARRDAARSEQLSKSGAVSREALENAQTTLAAARAAEQAARARAQSASLSLQYTEIRAPIAGTIGRVEIRRGGVLTAYQSLLTTLYSSGPMYVNFSISEHEMLDLARRFGSLTVAPSHEPIFGIVLADGSEYPERGSLSFVAPAVDVRTGTLALRLEVPNPEHELRSGQFVRVVVPTEGIAAALVVPQRAVQEQQGETFLLVLNDRNQVMNRDVTMGARLGDGWIVEKGLKAGERVVIDGAQKLKPGAVVKPEPRSAEQLRPTASSPG